MNIKNGFCFEQSGWKYISIRGKPKEMGYAHGYLCAKEFKKIQEMLHFFMIETYGYTWEHLIKEINDDFKTMTEKDFPDFYLEMIGISEGLNAAGTKTTVDEIIAWNFYLSIPYWLSTRSEVSVGREGGGGAKDRCSAFIAVGKDWTSDGKIVVAHNSFTDYIDGQWSNVILDINPTDGYRMIMQAAPCMIWSGTDFFVTSKGIIGTETTIGGFQAYEMKIPIGYRVRKCMQYGNSLDDYVKILLDGNSGDYANSWLFGDTETNEILRIELGLKFHNIERTKNGYFIGFNAPYDPRIRNLECNNTGFYDVRRHQGARKVRLEELMMENKGKLDVEIAKKIIADHYDVYLLKDNNPCSRTVCAHYDLDAREYMSQADRPRPFALHGTIDGSVIDTKLAKEMKMWMRYGNSCGMPFIAKEFFKKHIQWKNFEPYVFDRLSQPWAIFGSTTSSKSEEKEKEGKKKKYVVRTRKNGIRNGKTRYKER